MGVLLPDRDGLGDLIRREDLSRRAVLIWLAADQIGYVNPPRTVQFQVTWRYQ